MQLSSKHNKFLAHDVVTFGLWQDKIKAAIRQLVAVCPCKASMRQVLDAQIIGHSSIAGSIGERQCAMSVATFDMP
jgi:hypothetical protein